jgi:glycine oxidase ThiO
MRLTIVGAGVAGLTCAVEFAERGVSVEVLERADDIGAQSCSWYAGGMLAPWCERVRAEPLIATLGEQGLQWWCERFPGTQQRGSLVIAHSGDTAELTRFARRTERFEWLDSEAIGALEPQLSGRFGKALFFADEAHLDPRSALRFLAHRLDELGGSIRFGTDDAQTLTANRQVVDCSGLSAREALRDLRGVKGEMLVLRSREITLHRPVRVLHPRLPVYIVPRGDGVFMVGATTIESDDAKRITARSMLELLSAAYAVHPAFGEAEILEIGTQVRPAFPDNLPRIRRRGERLYVNGLFRHGFLLAPALAHMAAEIICNDGRYPEVMDEDPRERRLA